MNTLHNIIAMQVASDTKAADAGVVVSLMHVDGEPTYTIWAINTNGRINEHRLCASVTDSERLTAHVEGFISNHLRAWKAVA